jgi:hypothetical protein
VLLPKTAAEIVPVKLAVEMLVQHHSENPVADKIPVEGTKDKLALETLVG